MHTDFPHSIDEIARRYLLPHHGSVVISQEITRAAAERRHALGAPVYVVLDSGVGAGLSLCAPLPGGDYAGPSGRLSFDVLLERQWRADVRFFI